jgi:cyclopropane-fatty-acyl-phospholipid synthase
MNPIDNLIERKFANLQTSTAVVLPGGRRLGAADADVTLTVRELAPLAHLAAGQVGLLAGDYVEGHLQIDGNMRDVMTAAAQMIPTDPTSGGASSWWRQLLRTAKSVGHHSAEADARQVQFHYDVSDDFYALWLDARRVYSCAYYRDAGMPLAQAQEAKLDHVCRKLMLREGERFLDIGAGWGGLLLWAAEHYGVRATGITLSKNQHAHVSRLISERGLQGRVEMKLLDYRALPEDEPWDKIASIGMFEHVGCSGPVVC